MTDQWDRFAASAGRSIRRLGYEQNVELYQAVEQYEAGEGYAVDYPTIPTQTVSGMTAPPARTSDTDTGGTTREGDLIVFVEADTNPFAPFTVEAGETETIPAGEVRFVEDTDVEGTLIINGELVVNANLGDAIDDAGESGTALTRLEIESDDATYEVQTVEPQFDGLDRVVCSEVDT